MCLAQRNQSIASLHVMGVARVPGKDFGTAAPQRYFRLSDADSIANLQDALHRMRGHLERKAA